ncbi:hypothetical protein ZWY2020_027901, partial [Hordeum vulgare]
MDAVRLNTRDPARRHDAGGSVGGEIHGPRPGSDGDADGKALTRMKTWRGRQMHSHSYRVPEPVRGEVVVVIGCGESGKDIAMEIRSVAKEVCTSSLGSWRVTPGFVCARTGGGVRDGGGSSAAADTVIYRTGYIYSFPFLETGGALAVTTKLRGPAVRDIRVPAVVSAVALPSSAPDGWRRCCPAGGCCRRRRRCSCPWRSFTRAREAAGVPRKYTHEIGGRDRM